MRTMPFINTTHVARIVAFLVLGLTSPQLAHADGEKEAFRQAVADCTAQYQVIEGLWSEYQTAEKERQDQINQELIGLRKLAEEKVRIMAEAAIEAFKADPGGDPEVTNLLLAVVETYMVGSQGGGGDHYERAMPILEMLIDAEIDKPILQVWAVLCAVVLNDFDAAEKYGDMAKASGAVQADPGPSDPAKETFGIALRYLSELPSMRAKWEAEQQVRSAETEADDLPRVKLTTSKGDVVIELFENEAPIAVANFISLVKDGFYDGIVFHRVLARFMAQGGDPTGTGTGGPGYSIACECYKPSARKHFRGTLSMAHAGRDTGGSQFFLTFVPTDHLDGRHTVFGRVVEGFEVLGDLQRINPGERGPEPDKIVSATVLRDRGHGYEFQKLPGR